MAVSRDRVNELLEYKDGKLFWRVDRQAQKVAGKLAGFVHSTGYRHIWFDGTAHKAHRLVFLLHHGYLPRCIDHVNGNKDDNRIENLRPATHQENNRNARLRKDNQAQAKGVVRIKDRWRAYIYVGKKQHNLGRFDRIEEAKAAVAEARIWLHGDFARFK